MRNEKDLIKAAKSIKTIPEKDAAAYIASMTRSEARAVVWLEQTSKCYTITESELKKEMQKDKEENNGRL